MENELFFKFFQNSFDDVNLRSCKIGHTSVIDDRRKFQLVMKLQLFLASGRMKYSVLMDIYDRLIQSVIFSSKSAIQTKSYKVSWTGIGQAIERKKNWCSL